MRFSLPLLALAASAVATPMPQGVTEEIAPEASAPSGCSPDYSGSFQITVVNVTSSASKRGLERRQQAGVLTLELADGVLTDQASRTGYIASNYQFQFDGPPQAGAIYTAGFSACENGTLALGGSAIFYQCYTGGFYNLYDRSWAPQCSPIYLSIMKGGSPPATQAPDGQPGASTIVSQISDGQPIQTTIPIPISELPDGQPQGHTQGPIISQLSDGQPQAPTGTPVTQISDGQPQAPTGAPITQISDGQPQAPTGAPITQISDGQPQAPTGAPNVTFSAPPLATGAAPTAYYGFGAAAAAFMGFVMVL